MPKPWTPERRARHSVIMLAREQDPAYRAKIEASRAACLAHGRKFTDERRARLSARMLEVNKAPERRDSIVIGKLRAGLKAERAKAAAVQATLREQIRAAKHSTALQVVRLQDKAAGKFAPPAWCPQAMAADYFKLRRVLGAEKAKTEILALMLKDKEIWPFKIEKD